MTDRVLYCYTSDEPGDVARNMAKQKVQRLIVLDNQDSKRLAGVISVSDIAAVSRDDASGRRHLRLQSALRGAAHALTPVTRTGLVDAPARLAHRGVPAFSVLSAMI